MSPTGSFTSTNTYEEKSQWPPEMNKNSNMSMEKPSVVQVQPINLHQYARVDKIHIDGLKRTKDDIVKAQVNELFAAKDFYNIIEQSQKVKTKLETLGCFKNVGVTIDTSKGPDATPDGVEVTFNVRELKWLSGGVNTMVGNNEGSVLIQAETPNILGRGERLKMDYSYGSKSSSNINISAVKPFVDNWLHKVLTGTIFTSTTDAPWSGYKEKNHGILIDLAVNPPGALKHNFQYEVNYRDIIAAKTSSFYVREQCGPSLKSALRHILSIDKRDETIFPTSGSLVKFTTELAGLGGDIGFMKYNFELQSNWSPHDCLTFQLGAQAGFMSGISNDMAISIPDYFFLGGPMNLRGFAIRGCGPRLDGNAIGGNSYWALALHLYTPLPFVKPGKNSFADLFKLHGFINGGNLGNFKKDGDYSENIKLFTDNVRWSTGVGLALKLAGLARIELNLVWPLVVSRSDIFQPYQFGIGIQYL